MDRNHARGFTIIELVATLAVISVAVAVAVPTMGLMLQRVSMLQALHEATASFAGARAHAISSGRPVTVCPSHDGQTCISGTDWSRGWIAFSSPAKATQPEGPNAVLQVVPSISGRLSLRSTVGRNRIRYLPQGHAYGSNASLRLCTPDDGLLLATLVINNGGRVRTERAQPGERCIGQ